MDYLESRSLAARAAKDLDTTDTDMLRAFVRRAPLWTSELALMAESQTMPEAYRQLERLEGLGLVQRVVRGDPVSWRRTEAGEIALDLLRAQPKSDSPNSPWQRCLKKRT